MRAPYGPLVSVTHADVRELPFTDASAGALVLLGRYTTCPATAPPRTCAAAPHRNPTRRRGWFTTAYFHRPEELRDEVAAAGLRPCALGKPGSKIHVLCDRTGLPLTVLTSAANVPDAQLLVPLLDSLAPIRSRRGRPRCRPDKSHGDKAYDVRELRAEVRRRGIAVRIARKGVQSSERLGRHRWVVEACLSRLQHNRRLIRRYDRKAEHFQAFADLGCAILAYQRLTKHHPG